MSGHGLIPCSSVREGGLLYLKGCLLFFALQLFCQNIQFVACNLGPIFPSPASKLGCELLRPNLVIVSFLMGLTALKFDRAILNLRKETLKTKIWLINSQSWNPESQQLNTFTIFLVANPFRDWQLGKCLGAGAFGKVRSGSVKTRCDVKVTLLWGFRQVLPGPFGNKKG